jgi:hypothetical protein
MDRAKEWMTSFANRMIRSARMRGLFFKIARFAPSLAAWMARQMGQRAIADQLSGVEPRRLKPASEAEAAWRHLLK